MTKPTGDRLYIQLNISTENFEWIFRHSALNDIVQIENCEILGSIKNILWFYCGLSKELLCLTLHNNNKFLVVFRIKSCDEQWHREAFSIHEISVSVHEILPVTIGKENICCRWNAMLNSQKCRKIVEHEVLKLKRKLRFLELVKASPVNFMVIDSVWLA